MARAALRQIAMGLLHKYGGMKGREIGHMMGLDYSTTSQGRKRLTQRLKKDKELQGLMGRIEERLSRINRLLPKSNLISNFYKINLYYYNFIDNIIYLLYNHGTTFWGVLP
jgi:hypothetical protein